MSDAHSQKPSHIAYSVVEGKDTQSHWSKIGAAWETKNDGLTLQISSFPINGKIVLRSREELIKLREQRQTNSETKNQPLNP